MKNCYTSSCLFDSQLRAPNPESWEHHAQLQRLTRQNSIQWEEKCHNFFLCLKPIGIIIGSSCGLRYSARLKTPYFLFYIDEIYFYQTDAKYKEAARTTYSSSSQISSVSYCDHPSHPPTQYNTDRVRFTTSSLYIGINVGKEKGKYTVMAEYNQLNLTLWLIVGQLFWVPIKQ